jgi:hypothetical protein
MIKEGIMMLRRVSSALILAGATALAGATTETVRTIELVNNQPFAINMPVKISRVSPGPGTWAADRSAVQQSGSDLVVMADVPATGSRVLVLKKSEPAPSKEIGAELAPGRNDVGIRYGGKDAGRLAWGLELESLKKSGRRAARGDDDATASRDFTATFAPLPLKFERTVNGPLFDTWSARTTTAGLELGVELDIYHAGFLDIRTRLLNRSASQTTGVYCAVVCRWETPDVDSRRLCYDNRLRDFAGTTSTAFRAGTGHHWALARGVDWVRTSFKQGLCVVWLNDFAASFTYHDTSSKKLGGRWIGANQGQLAQEAQSSDRALYSITEIARANIARYRERFANNVLPALGEEVSFSSRLVFSDEEISDSHADAAFVGYTCYREQKRDGDRVRVTIGVPYVTFGTSYFPYSTLGENFGRLKLPGMDREGYWPLAADTVTQWKLFADDIRRDLRIAKAMGFETIRMHHVELLLGVDEKVRREYLDFFFGEMRKLKLKALVDIQMQPEEVAAIVKRYGDAIHGVEIENEVLIFGIKDGREAYWNSVYDAVKKVAPDMPVHLTSHINSGIFTRLKQLGGKTDRIGFHSYVDTEDAIPSGRDLALAMGNYAGKVGLPLAITEWNWRFMTRIPYEERAKLYTDIVGNALKTRSVRDFYQFQFTDSLAMNPRSITGIRHYEPLFLSRRPKPEAFELMKLIRQYSDPAGPVRQLAVDHTGADVDLEGRGFAEFRLVNLSTRTLSLLATVEGPAGMETTCSLREPLSVAPGKDALVGVEFAVQPPQPGFYHLFLRLEGDNGFLRYAWAEARMVGAPRLDLDAPTTVTYPRGVGEELKLDLAGACTVVYGHDSPPLELEIANLVHQTLESATGRPVGFYTSRTLPPAIRSSENLILVGTRKSNPLVDELGDKLTTESASFVMRFPARGSSMQWLVLGGDNSDGVEQAAVDFVLRYWRSAKDSATRRIGQLVEKDLAKGADSAKLP